MKMEVSRVGLEVETSGRYGRFEMLKKNVSALWFGLIHESKAPKTKPPQTPSTTASLSMMLVFTLTISRVQARLCTDASQIEQREVSVSSV